MGSPPGAARHDTDDSRNGAVDYRLQRARVLTEVRAGVRARSEVCDVHPELLRVARNVAVPGDETCPLCEDAALVRVSYVFGPRLPPGGKLCTTAAEVTHYEGRRGEFACYEVEVCPACGWNHLTRRYPVGRG